MQCYSELTPPTAVTHSLFLPFTSADAKNLIVAKTSLLQIFTTKALPGSHKSSIHHAIDTKLVFVAEYPLSGTITSLVGVALNSTKSGGHALLVGLKDARLSLVEWDPERHGLSTISIHYYEQDELQGSPWAPNIGSCANYSTADPNGRCAALKFGVRNLAVLPFKQGDGDINMDDEWDAELDGPKVADKAVKLVDGKKHLEDTPYGTSFVIQLSKLDSSIIYPIHLAFLHEYRGNPTFGILSSTQSPAASLIYERKDHLTYMVFTLDLELKESTQILTVGGLPYDLSKVIPLPSPIEGALLVGANELIHVDQSGKTTGLAVNMFAKNCTAFGLADQADLGMRLEGVTIDVLSVENGEMLMILHSGELAILSFKIDGRTVTGLSVRRVAKDLGGSILTTAVSSTSRLGTNSIFLGSETGNSVVLGWSRKSSQISRRKSRIDLPEGLDDLHSDEEEDDDDADDDLYGESDARHVQSAANHGQVADTANSKVGDYVFRIQDSMVNIAPIVKATIGKPPTFLSEDENSLYEGVRSELQLVVAAGQNKASSLATINQNIQPRIVGRFDFPDARGIWTINAVKSTRRGGSKEIAGDSATDQQYDKLMIVSRAAANDVEESDVFALSSTGFDQLTGTEFEHDGDAGSTIEVGTMGKGTRIIQILQSVVRIYDGDLGLAQILDMSDDDTGAEPKIVSASIADPFMLVIRDDSSIYVAQCDDNNEIDEIEREDDGLLATKWLTGCLYDDVKGTFSQQTGQDQKVGENVMMFLISAKGGLHVYALPDLSKPVYVAEGLCFVPPVLSASYAGRRGMARETLAEIIVADLGDNTSKSPYLILRPSNDNLTIYEPFHVKSKTNNLSSTLHFVKVPNSHLAQDPETAAQEDEEDAPSPRNNPMRAISNVNNYSTVFLPGSSPAFILKSAKTSPKVISLQGLGVRNMSSFHSSTCHRGFIYVDTDGIARVSQLPPGVIYDLGMPCKKTGFNAAIHDLSYHPPTETYVLATSTDVPFELPKETEPSRKPREETDFRPTTEQSALQLVNPLNWSIIDSYTLDPAETILCMETLHLEISELTNERAHMIVVGTALAKGEDIAIKGRIYVFAIVPVISDEDQPFKTTKLKLYAKEDIPRGAVTALCAVGTQGFMLVAQGQKCMVRGVKEDGSVLPVAFQDVNCYVTHVSELPGTGLVLMGDAMKSVWLTGYCEDPYKMVQLGKSVGGLEVVAAGLLPVGKTLEVIVADAEGGLSIWGFDPEDPKSLSGHLLLHRTTFNLGGNLPTSTLPLPRTFALGEAEHQLLIPSITGSLALLTPLSEPAYRKLSALAAALGNALYHPLGLNPRAYRIKGDEVGGRNVVDGTLVGRWRELGSGRLAEVVARVGGEEDDVRSAVREVRGGGLGFL